MKVKFTSSSMIREYNVWINRQYAFPLGTNESTEIWNRYTESLYKPTR